MRCSRSALLGSGAQADRQSSHVRIGAAAAPAEAPPARSLASATGDDRRYALANGCYALRSPSAGGFVAKSAGGYGASAASAGAAEGFRMQATALGSYLFYGRDRDFMAANALNVVSARRRREPGRGLARGREPGRHVRDHAAVEGQGARRGRRQAGAGGPRRRGRLQLRARRRLRGLPGGRDTSATGTPFTSRTPWGEVKGIIDLHLHMTAFEFLGGKAHCGRPWHPYGAPYALVDCPDHQVGNGCGAVLENALFGNPVRCHDPVGWPTFKDWPHHDSLTHEQTYYKWVERAYMGGLRLFVNLFVENRALCELYPLKQNDCDEMASVRLQNRDLDAAPGLHRRPERRARPRLVPHRERTRSRPGG